MVLNAIMLSAFGVAGAAQAQLSPAFQRCPGEMTKAFNWCPAQLSQEGWRLKYETESPRDLMDSYWRYEVWIRERLAVVCAMVGGRSGIRINGCKELKEAGE
jgi:hypothetical protein